MKQRINTKELKCDVARTKVVVRIVGKKTGLPDDAFARELEALTGVSQRESSCVVWWGIGKQAWSPYKSTFKVMVASDIDRGRLHSEEVFIKAAALPPHSRCCFDWGWMVERG